ncbi:hypothetical protein DL96DRAFT_1507249 [Flagelloscypha sp. PMI_526]|nr:hypothetical protein DL96DRAFT_1507249 [Flagelloscypha sp. PMI_526]
MSVSAPVELGASIFVEASKNLWRAADEFGLSRESNERDSENYNVGVWDGKKADSIAYKHLLGPIAKPGSVQESEFNVVTAGKQANFYP